jgi:hypothetical protein
VIAPAEFDSLWQYSLLHSTRYCSVKQPVQPESRFGGGAVLASEIDAVCVEMNNTAAIIAYPPQKEKNLVKENSN